MEPWHNFAARVGIVLLALAVVGPFAGRADLGQTLVLGVAIAGLLYLLGDLLLPRVLALAGKAAAAAGDGLLAAAGLRYLAPSLGASFGWGASLLLGALIGLGEYGLHILGDAQKAPPPERV